MTIFGYEGAKLVLQYVPGAVIRSVKKNYKPRWKFKSRKANHYPVVALVEVGLFVVPCDLDCRD